MSVRWLDEKIVHAIHQRSLSDHGGASGIRDIGLLQSALEKPKQRAHYETPSVYELATAYAVGIAKNHPFVDGNKRTAFYAAYVFLGINGYELKADEAEAAAIMVDLAASNADESDFSKWLEINSTKL